MSEYRNHHTEEDSVGSEHTNREEEMEQLMDTESNPEIRPESYEQDLSEEELLDKMAQLENRAKSMRHQNKMTMAEIMDIQERERSFREQNQVISAGLSFHRKQLETKKKYIEYLKEKTQSLTEELAQKNEEIKHLKTYNKNLQDQLKEAQTVIQSTDEMITKQSREIFDQKELNNLRQSDQDQMPQTSTDASTGTSQTRSWWQLCTKCMFKVGKYALFTGISFLIARQVFSLLPDYCHGHRESIF